MQRSRSMAQALSFLETSMAAVGHFREQIPQNMQALMSMSICPLVLSQYSRFTTGYMRVAGFLKSLLRTYSANFIVAI